jgi:hypothetical protein
MCVCCVVQKSESLQLGAEVAASAKLPRDYELESPPDDAALAALHIFRKRPDKAAGFTLEGTVGGGSPRHADLKPRAGAY